MAMWRFQCLILWFGVIFCPLQYRNVWASLCHREEHFSKLETEAGSFPSITPIKITTKSALTFCSIECLEVPECKSFAFLTATNTDNCLLGPTKDGLATSTEAVVYRLRTFGKTITSCASRSPCKNGGTCIDVCDEPYYMCTCPAHAQGDFCEWDTSVFVSDWWDEFDNEGTHTCAANTFMAGFKRSECENLGCIEEAICGPPSIKYSESTITCQNVRWWDTFATDAWSLCSSGYLLRGFYRSGDSQHLGWLEEGVCCKPVESPDHLDCYFEDIGLSFDAPWATASCNKPLYFIHGIRTSNCDNIKCIEELKCCKMV